MTQPSSSPDPIDEWVAAHRAWAEANDWLLQHVYQFFLANGSWPSIQELGRDLYRSGRRDIDLEAVLSERPNPPGRPVHPYFDSFSMSMRDLATVEAARPLLALVVLATQIALEQFEGHDEHPLVTRADLRPEALTAGKRQLLQFVPRIIFGDSPNAFGGGSPDGEWSLVVTDGATLFEGVRTIDQYLEAQANYFRKLYSRLPQHEHLGEPGRSIFVVMPFGTPWSDEVLEAIIACAHVVDPEVEVVRADRIAMPGRITDQIVDAITHADFIVADVTGSNPNVFWELGYAHALGRPTVLLSQDIESAPFDLQDHRMVGYSLPLDDSTRQVISSHMAGAAQTG